MKKENILPSEYIEVKGARVHNLKNVDINIPKNKLIVFTGISGSGKSSLAFDTIYAEGQRRYVESLSSYARQFLGRMDKPDVDQINGLSPAISIDQRSAASNPRSTVGTITEIYDYLRLLFARAGRVHCPSCHKLLEQQTAAQIVQKIIGISQNSAFDAVLLAPIARSQKKVEPRVLEELRKAGYGLVRIDNSIIKIADALNRRFDDGAKHTIEVVVSAIAIPEKEARKKWPKHDLERAVDAALDLGNGQLVVTTDTGGDMLFSEYFICIDCGITMSSIEPRNFSFNSPAGACPRCLGIGTCQEVDPELVIPNARLTLAQGAIKPWARNFSNQNWYWEILNLVSESEGFSLNSAMGDLDKKHVKSVLYGTGDKEYTLKNGDRKAFEGVVALLEKKYQETGSDYLRQEISQYMRESICPQCHGKRLKNESLSVLFLGKNIAEISSMTIEDANEFFQSLMGNGGGKELSQKEKKIAQSIIKEIAVRLEYLCEVGLNYLTLDRSAASLSGGEAQRIRLATQLGLSLSGVVYILDEPSIGLHQKDNQKLIETLKNLRDQGNTVIVVEHDEQTMKEADVVVDIGPGAGEHGGRIVAQGTPDEIMKDKNSVTGEYLSKKREIASPKKYRKGNGKFIEIVGAEEFNLKNIDVKIPLGKFVCLTGVSGSGKSTLMLDILVRALAKKFYRAKDIPGKHKEIKGLSNINKVISIDQSPIGRTPRSNPATYTGVFTYIRDVFTQVSEARIRGYSAGKFSFNAKGGRCENCSGEGMVRIEMQFLPDVYVQCEECHGKRYQQDVLEIHYMGKNIADVLEMSVEEAMRFFSRNQIIHEKLKTLNDVGLGYVKLGQSATTLSGGEAQRVKLATELSRRATGKTLYILDEPTTGLHFEDIKRLLEVLNHLVDRGNTVLIIEHNLDVIKSSDWIIDLGPEGGDKGGEVVIEGTPKDVLHEKKSHTARYLREVI